MTGIKDIPEKLGHLQQQNINKPTVARNDLFKQAFNEALSSGTQEPDKVASTPSLGEINAIRFNTVEPAESKLGSQTEQLLNSLDSYGKKLSNPDISLREIEPLISDIKTKADKLSLEASKSGNENPELKRIADESAVSANTEYIRFMRGDYV